MSNDSSIRSVPSRSDPDGSFHVFDGGTWEQVAPPGTHREQHHDAVAALATAALRAEEDRPASVAAARRALAAGAAVGQREAVLRDALALLAKVKGTSAEGRAAARRFVEEQAGTEEAR